MYKGERGTVVSGPALWPGCDRGAEAGVAVSLTRHAHLRTTPQLDPVMNAGNLCVEFNDGERSHDQ